MYCPQCQAEFRPGFDRCNECDVPLVAALPTQEIAPEEALEVVFSSRDPTLWPVVRSLFDARGIPYVVQGEKAMGLLPIAPIGGILGRTGMQARLLVPTSRVEEARALIADTDDVENATEPLDEEESDE
jgi:hypothetical protein